MPSERHELTSALLASAGGADVSVIPGLEPAWPGASLHGRALTVRGAPGDNLALHLAIAQAAAGDVIVIDVDGERDVAHFGDILARAARRRGIAGIVINGSIRDRRTISELGYPVFHVGTSPRGPAKLVPGRIGVPIELMGVRVGDGDLVWADDDGVVVVPAGRVDETIEAASALADREAEITARVEAGESTVAIFGLQAGQCS